MKKSTFLIPLPIILLLAILIGHQIPKGDSNHRLIIGERANTVPVIDIYLNRPNGKEIMAESKSNELGGFCVAYNENGQELGTFKLERINARGHNSFFEIKHGYSLKFIEKVNLYDMGKANKYALLPCYRDTCLLSYLINKQISNDLDFGYNLGLTPVHVNMNDEYVGLYLLAEKIELDPSRIDVLEQGAFIFELADKDYYAEGEPDTEGRDILDIAGERIILRDYMGTSPEQIQGQLNTAYDALTNENEIWNYWDIDSMSKLLATGFMASEISFDASVYFLYDPTDQKIHALPYWDVEHSYIDNPDTRFYTMQDWYDTLTPCCVIYDYLEHNDTLNARIRKLYKEELRNILINLNNNIETEYFEKYTNDMLMDFEIYGESEPNRILNIEEKNEDLKTFFESAIDICDKEWLSDNQ